MISFEFLSNKIFFLSFYPGVIKVCMETGHTTQLKPAITICLWWFPNWIRAGAFSILKDSQDNFVYLIVSYNTKNGVMISNMKFVLIHINFLSEEVDMHWEKEKKKKGRRNSDVIKEKHQQCINPENHREKMGFS